MSENENMNLNNENVNNDNPENVQENTNENINNEASEHIEAESETAANAQTSANESSEGSSENNYTYYNMDQSKNTEQEGGNIPSEEKGHKNRHKKEKQKRHFSTGGKFGIALAMAASVGVVAGGAFYGVNYAANSMFGNGSSNSAVESQADTSSDSSDFKDTISEIVDGNTVSGDNKISSTTDSVSGNMTVKEVANACLPSVVTIATVSKEELSDIFGGNQSYEVEGGGTGVIIGQNDTELLIATNNHVISSADSLSVGFIDGTTVTANVKGQDADNDLAVVAVSLEDISEDTLGQISVATIGDSDALQLGDQVVAIGNSLGYGQSVTSGYVSAKDRSLTLTDGDYTFESDNLIQTDAAINEGNSGGALLNMKGELVGINEAKRVYSTSGASVEGMGYAIPISKAEPILSELMTLETRTKVDESEKGYLGVTCADVTSEAASMYSMPQGVCVMSVVEGGPSEAAGLKKGDVITAIDGYEVASYEELTEQLEYYAKGTDVELTVYRADNGEYTEQTVTVTLGDSSVVEQYNNSNGGGSNGGAGQNNQ